ncbi:MULTISPECIES: hypothetical protein [Pseudoalteromonas]|uniref:Uncharacterized protein n=1 Tax=Pseudoalteromonas obscura TaxID=3048491 RepID=A0ABT7ERU1_9GAMM|nr:MULTISPECIES: hypothetical protein [Pseudoalteromonas]MBQ4839865.1 hypothetical protein [Pseudoalteromonas luteoviolacea]MDK2597791.1 hypothetical protein [Pseudoalteromonas sp. P94(2023)]
MKSLFTLSLILPTFQTPMIGQLYLQEPAVEYYFTRETGTAIRANQLEVGSLVEKGQVLLTFKAKSNKGEDKVYISNTNGYVEFISEEASTQSQLSSGDLMVKVSSSHVLGIYNFDKNYDVSQLDQSLWLCTDRKPVKFKVDSVLESSLLVSVELSQMKYSDLLKFSRDENVQLYPDQNACVTN